MKGKNVLKFSRPARWWGSSWREALVSGNGFVGCSVLGGASDDVIMLSHADLWWQGKVGVLPEVSDNLKKVRAKVDEGKYMDAQNIIPDALIAKGYRPSMSYPLPLCDFRIKLKTDRCPKDYSRFINLDNGEITVAFRDGAARIERSVFVSRKQEIIAFEIKKSGPKAIDVCLGLEMHDKFNNRTPSAISNLPEGVKVKAEGKYLFFAARSDNGADYGAVAYVNHFGGQINGGAETLSVSGAEKVFVVIKPFVGVKNHEVKWKELRDELKGFKLTYDKLLKEHTSASRDFSRAYISLSDEDTFAEKMLYDINSESDLSPESLEKLWSYGRHLFVSSTAPTSVPIAPYGLWCGDYKGYCSNIKTDGSLQLMYEHALSGNLIDYLEPVFKQYETVIDDLKKNAIRLFDARGIMLPSVTARGTGLLGQTDAAAINFTGAAGWLARLYYETYLYTGDVKFLKSRALPFMSEVAKFYMEFFTRGADGFYESNPSFSPGSEDALECAAAGKNALIDFAIAKELFTNLIEGSIEAGANKVDVDKWKDFLNHIPAYKTNTDGTYKEYFDINDGKNGSSALFYPVFPANEVNECSGEAFKQFEKTAAKRFSYGAHQTSSSLSRFANLFVRLNQPQNSDDIILSMLKSTAMDNLIFAEHDWTGMGTAMKDNWATFSIESNLILVNAVQEMFMRSDRETISLLPACSVQSGSMGGFLTRAGVEVVELEWDLKKGNISLKLKARKQRKIVLRLPMAAKKYKGPSGAADPVDQKLITNIDLPAGKVISIDIKI